MIENRFPAASSSAADGAAWATEPAAQRIAAMLRALVCIGRGLSGFGKGEDQQGRTDRWYAILEFRP